MKTLIILFGICAFLKGYYSYDREIHCDINPGCLNCNDVSITLFYVQAIGENDVIHNVWDFSHGKPSILFAVTDFNTTFDAVWNNTRLQNLTFSKKPKYRFGLVINKIWEFNDLNDTGTFNPENKTWSTEFDLGNVVWHRFAIAAMEEEALIRVKTSKYSSDRNGSIIMKLNLFPYMSYGFELPHLIHSANSTLIDIELVNMTTNKLWNQSRFALELLLISSDEKDGTSIDINIRKGLDDEHTPGVFEIIELITPKTIESDNGGFVQFRPVSYVDQLRDVSTSTPVHFSDMTKADIENGTSAHMFFEDYNGTLLTQKLFISFGAKGDGYYERAKYNVWMLTAGYGKPPMEGFSLFVILIISIGLGLPFVIMFIGGIYVCCKRKHRTNNQPEILVED